MNKNEGKMTNQENGAFMEGILLWRQQLIQRVLRAMVVFGLLMVAAGSYSAYTRGAVWAVVAYVGVYVVLVVLALWRQAPYVLQVGVIQVLLYTIAVVTFFTRGVGDSSRLYLLTMVFVSGLFWGRRASFFTLGLVLLTMIGLSWAFPAGYITGYEEVVSTDLSAWIALTVDLFSMSVFIVILLNYFTFRSNAYMAHSRKLTQELQEYQAQLEEQVQERTAALEQRNMQLEAAAQVAREAAEIRDVEQLLDRTVRLISNRFGFYHTGIFLLDGAATDGGGEYAVLRAASSAGGQRMLARGYRLRVGAGAGASGGGIVGYVIGRGEHCIVLDVGAPTGAGGVYFDNPEMPETRSEMALPLRVRGNIIGALDVQSIEPDAFTQEDVTVLQTLADQVAVAIENARLLAESQTALESVRRAHGEISREAWGTLLRTRSGLGARYDPHTILPPAGYWREGMRLAVREERSVFDAGEAVSVTEAAVPIKVRGQVIGVLDARKPEGEGEWGPGEIALLEMLTEQLSTALESAQLYQDSQSRAAREQLVGQVTGRMRESLDVDTVLQTAIREIGQALNITEVEVQMGTAGRGKKEEGRGKI